MKKFYLLFALFIGLNTANSLTFTVTACSFADTANIQYGSAQWIDAKTGGGYTSSDHLQIYLFHMNGSTVINNDYAIIFDQVFWSYYLNLPQQANGSRRIYFNMPTNFTLGKFELSINLTPFSKRYGKFVLTTGIKVFDPNPNKEVLRVNYYDINGKTTDNPMGLYIKETVFTDETVKREKFYLIE
jgi:hypothetical protein